MEVGLVRAHMEGVLSEPKGRGSGRSPNRGSLVRAQRERVRSEPKQSESGQSPKGEGRVGAQTEGVWSEPKPRRLPTANTMTPWLRSLWAGSCTLSWDLPSVIRMTI